MPSNKNQFVKKAKAKPAAKKAAPSKAKSAKTNPKAAAVKVGPRHPRARVIEGHGSKAALAKAIAPFLASDAQDTDEHESRLQKASNAQLLRLQRATQTLKDKYGNRDKLIAVIGEASKKGKDKDYLARLGSYSLSQLLDLAATSQRAAR
jgi:hypothetical protein